MRTNEILFSLEKAYHITEIKQQIDSSNTIDDVISVLKTNDIIDCTAEELQEAVNYINNQELSDEQLNNVCGGQYGIDELAFSICEWIGHQLGKLFKQLDLTTSPKKA